MAVVNLNIPFDAELLLEEIGVCIVSTWLERKGISCISKEQADNYVNIEKSMGTVPFYKLLVDNIESGKLSLELIAGHVITRKMMNTAERVANKPQ